MTSKLVRCIEGHVFDLGTSETCTICGNGIAQMASNDSTATQDVSLTLVAAGATEVAARTLDGLSAAARSLDIQGKIESVRTLKLPRQIMWAGAGAAMAGAVALFFLYRAPATTASAVVQSPPVVNSQTTSPTVSHLTGPNATDTNPVQSATDSSTSTTGPSNFTTRETQAATAPANLSPTLTTALNVEKAFLEINTGQWADAAKIGDALVKAGNARGGVILGRIYESGDGVPIDHVKARQYFLWATRLGDPDAALELGRQVERGEGGKADPADARQLYLYAARNNVSAADDELKRLNLSAKRGGTIFDAYGNIAAGRNVQRASQFLNGMSKARSGLAYCAIGTLYLEGQSVPPDAGKASQLLMMGGERGYSWCALGLAHLASTGAPGIEKSLIEAHVWYDYVRANGNMGERAQEIAQNQAAIDQQLTPQDLASARTIYNRMTGSTPDVQQNDECTGDHPALQCGR